MGGINTVRKEGNTRVIAVGKIIPADWQYVTLSLIKATGDVLTVKIEKVR